MRKQLARWGNRGGPWVKLFIQKPAGLVRVQWKESRQAGIETQSRPDTPENRAELRAWADGLWKRLQLGDVAAPEPLTLRDLWQRYSLAEFPHLRPRSRTLYHENYRRWAVMFGWEFVAERTTPEMADEFRAALSAQGLAITTIKKSIDDVKRVFSWAESRDLLQRNRLRLYRFKVAKEERPIPPAEYRGEEFEAILAQLAPTDGRQWRAWVALTLCAMQGARQNAVLHLTLDDVDAERIHWRARWDKLGRDWVQPLRERSREAIRVALEWRERLAYTGPWLIPPGSSKNRSGPYSKQSLWAVLQRAEAAAKIPKQARRGAHGLRRMLAGDVAAATGDAFLGLRAIGDTDPRMATRYVQNRDDRMVAAFAKLDREQEPKAQPNRNADNDEGATPEGTAPATPDREGQAS